MSTKPRILQLYAVIGRRVQECRADLELTQDELARRAGVARTSITNLENGRQRIPLEGLLQIADALGIELRELVPARADLERDENEDKIPVRVGGTERMVSPQVARVIRSHQPTAGG